jgi:hypothetical protein
MAFANGGIAALRYDEGGDIQQPAYSNDEKGNLVDANGNIVFTAEARDDPYIKSIFSNINSPVANDPTEAQAFYDLKTKNPKQFYSQVADKLGSQIINSYQGNQNYDTEYNQLQALKEIDPAAYYRNQLGFKAHSMGWQVGQNRGERNAPTQAEIESMIPQAQKAGLSEEEINSIVNQNFGQARNRNVQRIASELEAGGSGFSFQKDVQPMWPVLAAALTAGASGAYAGAAGAAEAGIGAGAGADVFGGLAGTSGSYGGLTAAEQAAAITAATPAATTVPSGITSLEAAYPGVSSADLGTTATNALYSTPSGPLTSADLAKIADIGDAGGFPTASTASKVADTAGMNMYQKLALTGLASKALTSTGGSSGGGSGTQSTTQSNAPTTTMTSTPTRAPTAQAPVFTFPTMSNPNQSLGTVYNPYLFNYQTRNAAQGGLMYADGGIADLGGYAAGGKLLKGPGDGMSDSIVANIGGKQPARLADGEFVVPADVVSHLGNGSTDAGAKHLYKMMDNIRKARTGNPKQGKKINADKFLPRN